MAERLRLASSNPGVALPAPLRPLRSRGVLTGAWRTVPLSSPKGWLSPMPAAEALRGVSTGNATPGVAAPGVRVRPSPSQRGAAFRGPAGAVGKKLAWSLAPVGVPDSNREPSNECRPVGVACEVRGAQRVQSARRRGSFGRGVGGGLPPDEMASSMWKPILVLAHLCRGLLAILMSLSSICGSSADALAAEGVELLLCARFRRAASSANTQARKHCARSASSLASIFEAARSII
mmetsp:Transcript_79561/g.150186  ORF Transcript_79561/g.150186 Transcript_79561/m.150186 type:complete len:235 (-) Transcript_79561:3463-4167(-)